MTSVYDEDTDALPAPEPAVPPIFFDESVCGECGWTMTGTYCDVCDIDPDDVPFPPLDGADEGDSYSTDPLDL